MHGETVKNEILYVSTAIFKKECIQNRSTLRVV